MCYWQKNDDGILLFCQVQPKARRDALVGIHDGRLKIQITAPPTDGKANAHLIKYLAKCAGIAKSSISLVSGQSSRQKCLLLGGLTTKPDNFP